MDQAEIRALAKAIVDETFLKLGVDISTPGAVVQTQADFAFMRRSRLAGETFRRNFVKAAVYTAVSALVGLAGFVGSSLSWKWHP